MNQWFALNADELAVIMLLMERTELKDVFSVGEDYTPDQQVIDKMAEKQFFLETEDGRDWNPLIHFVMWNVLNADCTLRIDRKNEIAYCVYFKNDVMVLLEKRKTDPGYIFYLIPYIPDAVGGVAKMLDDLNGELKAGADLETVFPETAPEDLDELTALLKKEAYPSLTEKDILLRTEGCAYGAPIVLGEVILTSEGCVYAESDGAALNCTGTDYYGLVTKLSEWIISIHGSCIRMEESNE